MKQNNLLMFLVPFVIGAIVFSKKGRSAQESKQIDKDIKAEGNTTYANSQFIIWANRLEQAMFDVGTDEAAIYNIFNYLKTDGDLLTLIKAFGMRRYSGGFLPAFLNEKLSLVQWIQEELNTSEMKKLNDILKSKGIKYRF